MKRIVPIWLLICIGMVLLLLFGGSHIYNQRNDTKFEEINYIGDIKALDGVSIELNSRDRKFKQDTILNFHDGLTWESEFKALYYTKETYESDKNISLDTGSLDEILEREKVYEKQPGEYRYKVRDYYKYMPINFRTSIGAFMTTRSEVSELLQISVPESAELVIETKNNGITSISHNAPMFSINASVVRIGDQYYFSISNLAMENGWYKDSENVALEYRGTSGIMMFDRNQDWKFEIPIDKAVKVLFPIEIGSGKEVTVLNLSKVTEKDYLALTVLEESTLYLYLYDVKNDKLITKANVGELPKDSVMQGINYVEQGDYLLANYYYLIDTMNEESTYESICAVYKISKQDEVEVIINLNYAKKLKEQERSILLNFVDMYYQNSSLYMLFRNNDQFNNIDLIAVNNDNIIYAGTIQSSMNEDHTIGSTNYNLSSITDYGARSIQAKFVR